MSPQLGADVVIVGARCAGATLAALLASAGIPTIAVDRAHFPSSTVSTHTMHADALSVLRRTGALAAVESLGAPRIREIVCDYGDFQIVGAPPPIDDIDHGLCVRRVDLDAVLVEHARRRGAQVIEGVTAAPIVEDGRVTGVRAAGDGASYEINASLVVGADGRTSTMARAVQARYLHRQSSGWFLWFGYFSDLEPRKMAAYELYFHGASFFYVFPTTGGHHVIGGEFSFQEYPGLLVEGVEGLMRAFRGCDALRERLGDARLVDRPFVLYRIESFRRVSVGPGWALVGDASFFKDPCTGQGMYDALRAAELLAQLVAKRSVSERPLDDLSDYALQSEREFGPWYRFTCRAARAQPMSTERGRMLRAIASDRALTEAYLGIQNHTTNPDDFFAKRNVARLIGAHA